MVWSLVHSEDEIQATQSPFNANWDLIHCKPSTDPKSILHQSNANRVSKWGHSKLDNPVQQQFFNQLILANPCRYRPIRANPHQSMHYPIHVNSGQSAANPWPIRDHSCRFSLTHQSSNLCSSLSIHANPCRSCANWRSIFNSNTTLQSANSTKTVPIHANPCQSWSIQCQS